MFRHAALIGLAAGFSVIAATMIEAPTFAVGPPSGATVVGVASATCPFRTQAPWWAVSFTVHMVGLASLLLLGRFAGQRANDEIPTFDEAQQAQVVAPELKPYELGDPQLDPSVLDTESLMQMEPSQPAQTAQYNDDSPVFEERGGGIKSDSTAPDLGGRSGFDVKAVGPGAKVTGSGGIGQGIGTGNNAGSGGDGSGFGGRGSGSRKALLGRYGGTHETERAVGEHSTGSPIIKAPMEAGA